MKFPFEPGQRMIIRPNNFGTFIDKGHLVVLLQKVVSTKNGTFAHCHYYKEQKEYPLTIPLFLLWRIADEEDLLEMHENYLHSKNLI